MRRPRGGYVEIGRDRRLRPPRHLRGQTGDGIVSGDNVIVGY